MRKLHCAIITFFCVLILTTPSLAKHASHPVTPTRLFQAMYNNADSALSKKDIEGSMAYWDPDFVQIDPGHTENDIGTLRYRISGWLDSAMSVHASSAVMSASIEGVNGSVLVRSVFSMILINPDTHSRASFIYRYVARDKWAHGGDGWMMLRSEVISDSATLNGRKVYNKDEPFAPAPATVDSYGDPIDNSSPADGSGNGDGAN